MESYNIKSGVFCLVLVALFGSTAWAKKIPSYVQVCKKNDPQYDSCVLKSIEAIRPRLAKGISKMQVPPAEPFQIPALEVNRDLEALRVKAKLRDIRAFGGSNFVINKLKTDVNGLDLEMSLTLPHIYVTSHYEVDGRLLLVPLRGRGLFLGNFTNTKIDVKGSGKLVTQKGQLFIEIQQIQSKIAVGDSSVKFQNTDRDNDLITSTAANFINQNKRQVFQIITPIVEETANEVMLQFGNRIFLNIPYSEILPE